MTNLELLLSILTSVSPKSANRNAKRFVPWICNQRCVLKYFLHRQFVSSLNLFVSVAVCALKDAHLKQSKSSICQRVSNRKSLTDMAQILSSFTDCQPQDQVKFWVLSVQTVLVNQLPLKFCLVIFSLIWEGSSSLRHGKTFWNSSEAVSFKTISQSFSRTIWRP
jgi:hypothetical protein